MPLFAQAVIGLQSWPNQETRCSRIRKTEHGDYADRTQAMLALGLPSQAAFARDEFAKQRPPSESAEVTLDQIRKRSLHL